MESILKNRLLNNQLDRKTVIRVEASLRSGYSIFVQIMIPGGMAWQKDSGWGRIVTQKY